MFARAITVFLGAVVGSLAIAQLVLGRLLLAGTADIGLRVAHEHLGYTLVALTLLHVILCTWLILRKPT